MHSMRGEYTRWALRVWESNTAGTICARLLATREKDQEGNAHRRGLGHSEVDEEIGTRELDDLPCLLERCKPM